MLRRLFSRRKPAPEPIPQEVQLRRFRVKYDNFKILLESNAELLKILSDMEEKLTGRHLFGMAYVRSQATRMLFHAARMIKSLESLAGEPHIRLRERFDAIQNAIRAELDRKPIGRIADFVLPHASVNRDMVDHVGGKNAHLGEMASRVGIPVPRGFAITTTAFEAVLAENDLLAEIHKLKMGLHAADPAGFQTVSDEIQRLFLAARIPAAVEDAIGKALSDMASDGASPLVALRSSAVGEDSELSFAGQYLSVLNVPMDRVMTEYLRVLGSLFTPQAIAYRLHMGIPFEEAAMSVACVEMVPAVASGVMYTRHPFNPLENHIIVNAVWGLGPYAVDGVISPDVYLLSRKTPPELLSSAISHKPKRLVGRPDGYLADEPVPEADRDRACLPRETACVLAEMALRLESHFQTPQDIEWALDASGRPLILQARPLRFEAAAEGRSAGPPLAGREVLLEGGDVACPGVGMGPAYLLRSEADIQGFPEGAVLVAAHPSPGFVVLMERARAILTDSGSITGHMASLAREFRIPAILNMGKATSAVTQGAVVTVDAYSGRVYRGEVPELAGLNLDRGAFMKDTPVYNTLRKLADLIVPLHLVDPKSPEFRPRNCKTIHDIMRLAHERAYQELFQISDLISEKGSVAVRLRAGLPIDLYLIDLGGGVAAEAAGDRSVTPEGITSAPFRALLGGMLRDDLKHHEPRPVDLGGFLSVMSRQMLNPAPTTGERFGDRSYAIISDKYLNFSSRVGYHYSVLDAYCGQTNVKNYINFQFKGGAADDTRRNRRARMICLILEKLGFLTEVTGDRVVGRFTKRPADVTADKLDQLGRLLIYTRQMDMLMWSEESVALAAECFMAGDYTIRPERGLEKR